MLLVVNGIPVFAFELKDQYTGQSVDNARTQWMYDRDSREICFQFNKRILTYFCVDYTEVWMIIKLAGKDIYFLPFNQGSNGWILMAVRIIRPIQTGILQHIFGKMYSRKIVCWILFKSLLIYRKRKH